MKKGLLIAVIVVAGIVVIGEQPEFSFTWFLIQLGCLWIVSWAFRELDSIWDNDGNK